MDVPLILESEYIPEWRRNKEAAEPITVVFQPLTAGQRTECINIRTSEHSVTGGINMPRLVEYGVREIKNLAAGGVSIATGRQLVSSRGARLHELVLELASEIIIRNQEQDLKNS